MNRKHRHVITLLLGAGLLGLSSLASAGIVNTKHNLGSGNIDPVNNNYVTDTADTCVFCHTPHKAASATVPLWNKGLTSSATYTAYSSTTMDGTTNFTGSTSMACLSCHDGTQAMDNIVNAPGSGGYTDGGADLAYTWNATTRVDATGKLVAGTLANLGDGTGALGDDHPVAIPYGGGGVTVATPSGATTDPDFVQVGTGLTQAVVGGLQKWWFDADADT
ncbi:MAG TPA: hypothetical protein VGE00_00410, partial [Gammaproteobacteria bacterium]